MNGGVFILAGIWLLPTVLVLMSHAQDRRGGWRWIVATLCLSWLGWVFYALALADD